MCGEAAQTGPMCAPQRPFRVRLCAPNPESLTTKDRKLSFNQLFPTKERGEVGSGGLQERMDSVTGQEARTWEFQGRKGDKILQQGTDEAI